MMLSMCGMLLMHGEYKLPLISHFKLRHMGLMQEAKERERICRAEAEIELVVSRNQNEKV